MRHFFTPVWPLNHIFLYFCLEFSRLNSHWTPKHWETVCMIYMWIGMQPAESGSVFSKNCQSVYWCSTKTRSCISMSRWQKYAGIHSLSLVRSLLKNWNLWWLRQNNCQKLFLILRILSNKGLKNRWDTHLPLKSKTKSLFTNKNSKRSRRNNYSIIF